MTSAWRWLRCASEGRRSGGWAAPLADLCTTCRCCVYPLEAVFPQRPAFSERDFFFVFCCCALMVMMMMMIVIYVCARDCSALPLHSNFGAVEQGTNCMMPRCNSHTYIRMKRLSTTLRSVAHWPVAASPMPLVHAPLLGWGYIVAHHVTRAATPEIEPPAVHNVRQQLLLLGHSLHPGAHRHVLQLEQTVGAKGKGNPSSNAPHKVNGQHVARAMGPCRVPVRCCTATSCREHAPRQLGTCH